MKTEKTAKERNLCAGTIENDAERKLLNISDGTGRLVLQLDYDCKCVIRAAWVKGRQVLSEHGAFSAVQTTNGEWHTTQVCTADPMVKVVGAVAEIGAIRYGGSGMRMVEAWTFTAGKESVSWKIQRNYLTGGVLSDTCFPGWNFQNVDTWTGALLDNGGVAWMKLLNAVGRTLGTHAGRMTFWETRSNSCLAITPDAGEGVYSAGRFSKQPDGALLFCSEAASVPMKTKYDLQNFRNADDVWAPFSVSPGTVAIRYELSAFDYDRAFDRGTPVGLDGSAVREMSNTIARYGVIDNNHAGLNGWTTGYVCLHEPYLGRVAAAVGQPDYSRAVRDTYDFYRDHAVQADGRVLARFQYMPGDERKGTRTDRGFYEAQWGTLLDSQTGYVIVAAELFHLNGDTAWIRSQKSTCEKALDYLLKRGDPDGLVKMENRNTGERKSSDWIDIVWAANENALVNAELYGALTLWAEVEEILEDAGKADFYRTKAGRLKAAFNRTVAQGGFWDPDRQEYLYWRDADGTVHGTNLVLPVQFAAIGYGVCDDRNRIRAVLGKIEAQMVSENLFSWPLCMTSFAAEETDTAFPGYENGDIFLSWNELGIRCYSDYDPAVAVKYVKNVIQKYKTDGLAFQRYFRKSQTGAGDDILAGNYMTIAGLYGSIYGIRPFYNRLYLEPHITPELNGTTVKYLLRGQKYEIRLISPEQYQMAVGGFVFNHTEPFAVNPDRPDQASCFFGGRDQKAMTLARSGGASLTVDLTGYSRTNPEWKETSGAETTVAHTVFQLRSDTEYEVRVNGAPLCTAGSDVSGSLTFEAALCASVPYCFTLRETAGSLENGDSGR